MTMDAISDSDRFDALSSVYGTTLTIGKPTEPESDDEFPKLILRSMHQTINAFSMDGRRVTAKGSYEVEANVEKDADGTESVSGNVSVSSDNGTSISVSGSVDNQGNVSGGISVSGQF